MSLSGVNKTLFIPLYGKSLVSRRGIILRDEMAEKIWAKEGFPIGGKSRSKWLALNMAMRARVFDDWADEMIRECAGMGAGEQAGAALGGGSDALVLHVGCGLDSRCLRVKEKAGMWYDCDFPEVIEIRKKYYQESDSYRMVALNAAESDGIKELPDAPAVIVVLEGISMYLTNEQLRAFLGALEDKYPKVHVLMDIYTEFGVRASRFKNPVKEVGVNRIYGIDNIDDLTKGLRLHFKAEHTVTPKRLVNELSGAEKLFFKVLFTGKLYGKIYRLLEFETIK